VGVITDQQYFLLLPYFFALYVQHGCYTRNGPLSLHVVVNMSDSTLLENSSPRTDKLYCMQFFYFTVVSCILVLSKSFYFTNGCTIYLFSTTLKFTWNYTLKLLLHVSAQCTAHILPRTWRNMQPHLRTVHDDVF